MPTAKLFALLLALIAMSVVTPTRGRADSEFLSTNTPQPHYLGRAPSRGGLLARVRVAMGLSPEPGEPMRLIPPQRDSVLSPPEPASVEAQAMSDERMSDAPSLGEPPLQAGLRRPPPRPLVSVVSDPFGTETPENQLDADDIDPLAPATERPLDGSPSDSPAVPRRHPTRRPNEVASSQDKSDQGEDGALVVRAVTTRFEMDVALAANNAEMPSDDNQGEAPVRQQASLPDIAPPYGGDPAEQELLLQERATASPDGGAEAGSPTEAATQSRAAAVRTAISSGDDSAAVPGPRRTETVYASAALAQGATSATRETGEADSADAQDDTVTKEATDHPVPPSEIPRLMRTMSALQDDIALGASTALAAQRILSTRVAKELAKDSPETLAQPINARALLHYALTGGSPRDVRAAVDKTAFSPPYDALLAGALAFLEGRQNDARRHFKEADLDRLPRVTQGPVHLALAALAVDEDADAALQHLDWARHSAPGTLVEEAALRRAVLIAAERNEFDRFASLTNRYLRKFRRSAYAGNFRRRLASALTRMEFLNHLDGFDQLETILKPMATDGRREIYLDLARSAVENGRSAIAARAARISREMAPTDSLDATRADLYAAAADVVDPQRNDAAIVALDTIDIATLPEGDRVLRTAALRLGQAVADLPNPSLPAPPASLTGSELASVPISYGPTFAEVAIANEDEPSAIEQRVNDTLAEIDAILRSSP